MKQKILFCTVDVPPTPKGNTFGGGVRVQTLAALLRSWGHEVVIAVQQEQNPGRPPIPKGFPQFSLANLDLFVAKQDPDVVLFEQWHLLSYLDDCKRPIVVDLHGSLLLENAFRGLGDLVQNASAKIKAFAKADLFIVPNNRQKDYFYGHALLCGKRPEDIAIAVVPQLLSETPPKRVALSGMHLLYAGNLWPWIQSTRELTSIASAIRGKKDASLTMRVGNPLGQEHGLATLADSPSIAFSGLVPRSEITAAYKNANLAVDLYEYNAERYLAASTRSWEYLWAGLPVLTYAYMDHADVVRRANAGIVIDSIDDLPEVLQKLLAGKYDLSELSANAGNLVQSLAKECDLNDLATYIAAPRKIATGEHILAGLTRQFRFLEHKGQRDIAHAEEQLKADFQRVQRIKDATVARLEEQLAASILDRDRLQQRLQAIEHASAMDIDDLRKRHSDSIARIEEKSLAEKKSFVSTQETLLQEKERLAAQIHALLRDKEQLQANVTERNHYYTALLSEEKQEFNEQRKRQEDRFAEERETASHIHAALLAEKERLAQRCEILQGEREALQARSEERERYLSQQLDKLKDEHTKAQQLQEVNNADERRALAKSQDLLLAEKERLAQRCEILQHERETLQARGEERERYLALQLDKLKDEHAKAQQLQEANNADERRALAKGQELLLAEKERLAQRCDSLQTEREALQKKMEERERHLVQQLNQLKDDHAGELRLQAQRAAEEHHAGEQRYVALLAEKDRLAQRMEGIPAEIAKAQEGPHAAYQAMLQEKNRLAVAFEELQQRLRSQADEYQGQLSALHGELANAHHRLAASDQELRQQRELLRTKDQIIENLQRELAQGIPTQTIDAQIIAERRRTEDVLQSLRNEIQQLRDDVSSPLGKRIIKHSRALLRGTSK